MPLYEYACAECNERFEILQSMGEGSDGISCPSCRSTSVARQLSTFAGMTATGGGATDSYAASSCSPSSPFT